MSIQSLPAVILAGGRATRLGERARVVPKSLIRFAGKPFLFYLVYWLLRHHCDPVVIAAGHLGNIIEGAFLTENTHEPRIRVVTEPQEMGTGGAIRWALDYIKGPDVFVCNGDTVLDLDLDAMVQCHHSHTLAATVAVTRRQDVQNVGAIAVGHDQRVIAFREGEAKQRDEPPTEGYAASSTGCYILRRDPYLQLIPGARRCSLERDVLPALVSTHGAVAYDNGMRMMIDFGTPERLAWLEENGQVVPGIYGQI